MKEQQISKLVFDAGLKVHKNLGPGLLESAYQECLFYELYKMGLKVDKQAALPLVYEEVKLEAGYRIDLLVEKIFVVEIKAVDDLSGKLKFVVGLKFLLICYTCKNGFQYFISYTIDN
ncbi:MAG: GxxExxY protein [Saprospiraceae bacterium]|nr:GxxExxY protein [Saprospiraceae bacterium]